jgi:hypothetical protein
MRWKIDSSFKVTDYWPIMAVWTTEPYRNLCIIGKVLMERIQRPDVLDEDLPLLVREMREVEAFKREIRGIPRLLGHKLDEVANARLATAKRLSRSNPHETPYTELDAPEAKPDASTPPASTEP